MSESLTQRFAERLVATEALSPAALHATKRAYLDRLASSAPALVSQSCEV